ncbi:transcription antitermination factor NusB [bacterium]|nr:transcription antitermination factor NusB [bacterium]
MTDVGADLRSAADALAQAARDGADLQALCRDGFGDLAGLERLRPVGALVMAANLAPTEGSESLLLDHAPLRRLERLFHRDDALAALYEAEQSEAQIDMVQLSPTAAEIVDGVVSRQRSLDISIGKASRGWRVERMPPVDRVVLRMALWELRNRAATPTSVVIAEAVRLATAYSTERSGRFVNGVLSALVGDARPDS